MAKRVEDTTDLVVVWWDGFGKEHQGTAGGGNEPVQWEFNESDAVIICKRQIKKGAVRAEIWRPQPTPEKIAAFERTNSGACSQVYPTRR